MDIQSYISSGILELWVIGQLSPREMREVEQMASQYPEIKKELSAIEQALEVYSLKNQLAPNPASFDQIRSEIQRPIAPSSLAKNRSSNLSPWLILFLGALSLGLAAAFFSARQLQTNLRFENEELRVALQECETTVQDEREADRPIAILRENGTSTILLLDPNEQTELQAVVYFNPLSQKSYLDPFQLPTPASGKQYQLWALIDGQPTDMGVFDLPSAGQSFIEVPYIAAADAFAITLEPSGGSVNPTLTNLQVIGNRI